MLCMCVPSACAPLLSEVRALRTAARLTRTLHSPRAVACGGAPQAAVLWAERPKQRLRAEQQVRGIPGASVP